MNKIPTGLIGHEFKEGIYKKFLAKGKMPNAVGEKWQEIWANDKGLDRKYSYDFDVYGKNSQNGADSEVVIYIAIA